MSNYKDLFVTQMLQKYESVPVKLKYIFIEKHYIKIFGKNLASHHVNMLTDECEDFIFAFENALDEFSKTVKKNLLKKFKLVGEVNK